LCRERFLPGFAAVGSVLISGVETNLAQARAASLTPKDARAKAEGLVAKGLKAAPPPTAAH